MSEEQKPEWLPSVSSDVWWKKDAERIIQDGKDLPTDVACHFMVLLETASSRAENAMLEKVINIATEKRYTAKWGSKVLLSTAEISYNFALDELVSHLQSLRKL